MVRMRRYDGAMKEDTVPNSLISYTTMHRFLHCLPSVGEWFDSWPGIRDIPQELRPMDMKFGDDSPISFHEKQLWTDIYDNFGIPLKWNAGDVAVLCNMRFAHGRPGIELQHGEQRELGVMLGRLFERQETKEDKW